MFQQDYTHIRRLEMVYAAQSLSDKDDAEMKKKEQDLQNK